MSVFRLGVIAAVIVTAFCRVCVAAPSASPSFEDLLAKPAKPAAAGKVSALEVKFGEAQRYQKNGQLDKALRIYKELDKISPKNLAVLLNMGVIYRMKNNPKVAKTYFARALTVSPNNPAPLFHLASISLQLKENSKALDYAVRLAKIQPKNFQVQYILGVAYLENNNPTKAKQALKKANAMQPNDLGTLFNLVKIATQENNYSEVLLYADKLLAKNPKDARLQMMAGMAAEKLNKRAEAIKHYESASNIPGVQIDALMNLGRLYAVSGQDQKSINALRRILKLDKQHYEANMLVAQKLYIGNNLKQAEPFFVAAQKSKPNNAEPTLFIALIRVRTNRLDDAFRAAQSAMDKAPKNKSVMEVYAYVQENRKVYTDAIDVYRKWLKLYPNDTVIYSKIANNLTILGKPDQAMAEYETAIKLHPKDFDLLLSYANLLLSQDSHDKAYAAFQSALTIKPGQADAVIGSAACLQKQDKSDEAKKLLEKLVSTDTTNERARMTLAGIYREQKQDDLAITQYKAILARSPHNMPALLSLVAVYEAQKEYGAAIDIYRKMLEADPKNTAFSATIVKLYDAWGKNDLAIEEAKKLLKADPKDTNYRAMLADLLVKKDDLDGALVEYAELAKADDLSVKAFALHKSGEIKEKQQDKNAAIDLYKKALAEVPDYGFSLTALEKIYTTDGKQDVLQAYLKELVQQAKDNSPYPFYYHLMHTAGKAQEVIKMFESLSASNPRIKALHSTLAVAYTDSGENEKAIEHYLLILEADQNDARTNQKLGQMLKKLNRDQEALKYLEKAASQLTFDRQLILDLAQTYEKLNDRVKARNTYKDYIKLDPKNQEVKDKIVELEVVKTDK